MTEIFQYTFMQNALLGCILSGFVCGMIGTYIVSRRMVFIAGGMAHASLGGVGICALAGWNPVCGAAVFSLLTGYSVKALSRRREIREDSAIAMLWALGMSIGVMCAFLTPRFLPDLSSYLFGNVLFITHSDLLFLAILALLVTLLFLMYMPYIAAVAFDREFAASQHLPVKWMEYVMLTFIALSIVACLRMVGIMMVISLLSVPQMTANLLTNRFNRMAALSVLLCIVCCLTGLLCSYRIGVPSGPTIVLTSVVIYGIVRTIKRAF